MTAQDKMIGKILDTVKRSIRPDTKVITDADKVVDDINTLLKKKKINAVCVKGGSIAKDTFLADDYDIDLFVRFNKAYYSNGISDILEESLLELCDRYKVRLDRIHGSRDYFQFHILKKDRIMDFEIIPVILIHSTEYTDALNITDLSPEHVDWVKKHSSKDPSIVDEIRLAKQFCKANKVYGAESYINGFSGHILDILIIHHGSFLDLVKAFSRYDTEDLKKPIIIDTEKHLKDPLRELNKSKITPLIIVDPIQKDRNSAAALSKEKLLMFIDACRRFLKKPDKRFFEIRHFDMDKEIKDALKGLKGKDVNITKIDMDTVEGSKDVIGTKALKAFEIITEQLTLDGFCVLKSGWNFIFAEKRAEAYMITDARIQKEMPQQGPPSRSKDDYKRFVQKHVNLGHEIFFKDDRVHAMVPRKFLDPKAFIMDLAKKEPIAKRVKGVFVR